MDQLGSLVDTSLRIYPSEKFIAFIETIPINVDVPKNILRFINDNDVSKTEDKMKIEVTQVHYTNADLEILDKIKKKACNTDNREIKDNDISINTEAQKLCSLHVEHKVDQNKENIDIEDNDMNATTGNSDKLYLTTSDIDWMYSYINAKKKKGDDQVPYLHEIFQGSNIEMPENRVIKRNPVLEARCVKLRAQQEAREYRKMTKGVDNVRMRYPEDSISYQLKQLNRQLIAIGQFIISIFAGFLFGFRGVEWMVGNLDFGVRLLLGVMCALIIALAEIYFLAKKLNEELTMTETIQLGGPPKFPNQVDNRICNSTIVNKEHQD